MQRMLSDYVWLHFTWFWILNREAFLFIPPSKEEWVTNDSFVDKTVSITTTRNPLNTELQQAKSKPSRMIDAYGQLVDADDWLTG